MITQTQRPVTQPRLARLRFVVLPPAGYTPEQAQALVTPPEPPAALVTALGAILQRLAIEDAARLEGDTLAAASRSSDGLPTTPA